MHVFRCIIGWKEIGLKIFYYCIAVFKKVNTVEGVPSTSIF